MVRAWIGNGSVMPSAASAPTRSSSTPRALKESGRSVSVKHSPIWPRGHRASLALPAMTLPLFDDQVARAPRQVTLVRLSGEIARSLGAIGRIAVEGEVYRPTTSRSGWVFFTLRDRAAQIEVKVPSSAARHSRVVA